MKKIDIKGKPYVMVNERLKAFRADYQGYALLSEIIELTADTCTIQAKIVDEQGRVRAMGTAREEREDKTSRVNCTSYVENCETSAWGRALGNLGIGIDESIASADEVARAIEKQERIKSEREAQRNAPYTVSYEEACKYQTKSKKTFDTLSNEELLEIIYSNVKDEYKFAAKAVLDYRDMQPLPESESSLPF